MRQSPLLNEVLELNVNFSKFYIYINNKKLCQLILYVRKREPKGIVSSLKKDAGHVLLA